MTWYETLYWWSFLIVPILIIIYGAILAANGDDTAEATITFICLYFLFALIIGLATASIRSGEEWVMTKKIEITPKVAHLSDDGLNIITENSTHFRFTDYKDIKNWENGGKFYAISYFNKENFGSDSSKVEVVIELEDVEK